VRLQDYVQIKAAAELLGVAPNTLRNSERQDSCLSPSDQQLPPV